MSEHSPLTPLIIASLLQREGGTGHIYLAYSGGMDSHVLLHLCQSLPDVKGRLTAVHVHHGLQEAADAWPRHCRKIAGQLGVDFLELRVKAYPVGRESPEEAARNARYDALKTLLGDDDVVLLAQHRDDQLETVLLQLFRGAGLPGLSAMPEVMVLGKGRLLRPLLAVSRRAMEAYARGHGLRWVADPSNRSDEFDRNFLRNQVLPQLQQRWPALAKTVSRSARHCAEASAFIEQGAQKLLARVWREEYQALALTELRLLDRYRQQLVIRHWFKTLGLKMPSQAFVSRVLNELVDATKKNDPILYNQGFMLRRYRDELFCVAQTAANFEPHTIDWPASVDALLLPDRRKLQCLPAMTGIDATLWRTAKISVRFRKGGEKIKLPKREGRHALKNLYQEAGIAPWLRPSIPLIYIDERLAAVADLWIDADFYVENNGGCIKLVWR
ncbi:MAG: tRNA lysidine(34) synthetase TilS [Gammaproteobacteria bacterium HGW-Gammaproteobacteria-10]|nr:MAG: tRNA lysidine(34) synthetase TilS [Gammaproteobacteria bacterium HGW-Gammaproteobacteria-3]PKM34556.1 MAG: tRNA lysidine(34) synthetase TilS [Gammaproteobacteria bacterium HGW-Gammaproteobacteria-10]